MSPTDEIKRAASRAISPAASAYTIAADASAFEAAFAVATSRTGSFIAISNAANAVQFGPGVAAHAADDPTAIADIWNAVREDAREVEDGASFPQGLLWPGDNPLQHLWEKTRDRWSEPGSPYVFWRRWYQSLLAGTSMNPDLLYEIALIPDDTWAAGPEPVAEAIQEIESELNADENELEQSIASMPPSSSERLKATKQAMERHRADLPATFDAILGFISLEVKRLQARNYRDDDDEEEARRQIRTLTTLYRAVEELQSLIPKTDEMPIEDAEKAEKLARLYLNKFKDWPRDHVGDVVGGVYAMGGEIAGNTIRMGLVAATAFALPMIGVPTPWALGAGIAVFGNKTIAEAAKTVRDSVFPSIP